jgi:hypothetical protein
MIRQSLRRRAVLKGQEKDNVVAIQAGAFGDTLHALGLFIEQAGLAWKEIAADGMGCVTIRWEDAPHTRLDPSELEALRRVARMHRGLRGAQTRPSLGRRLRAMGRQLDQLRARSFTVTTLPQGLRMSAHVVEGEAARIYTSRQVARLEREQMQQRAA